MRGARPFNTWQGRARGWGELELQNVWLGDFNERFIATEPRPLCAFLSGNFVDWCQQNREHWRGTAAVLRDGSLPIWASCGGAQGLAILAETGVDHRWDCPQCRDPKDPCLPIYTHIAGSVRRKCGDYSGCVFERGPFTIRQVSSDPVFPACPPNSPPWKATAARLNGHRGLGADRDLRRRGKTKTQCLRVKGRPIYAAQFHIEMKGTPESSKRIMENFLALSLAAGRSTSGTGAERRPSDAPCLESTRRGLPDLSAFRSDCRLMTNDDTLGGQASSFFSRSSPEVNSGIDGKATSALPDRS